MATHPFWGAVEEDWAGYSSAVKFAPPHAPGTECTVFLGDEYGEDGEEKSDPPTDAQLDAFAETYAAFQDKLGVIFTEIAMVTFERYRTLYAPTFETSDTPLGMDSPEKHLETLQDVLYLRVCDDGTILIPIRYTVDTEHGLEIRIKGSRVRDIGGIAET